MDTLEISVTYYAMLRELRGVGTEKLATRAETTGDLYQEIQQQHGWDIPAHTLKVAVNDEFCSWDQTLNPSDRVAFIPPIAGG